MGHLMVSCAWGVWCSGTHHQRSIQHFVCGNGALRKIEYQSLDSSNRHPIREGIQNNGASKAVTSATVANLKPGSL